MIGSLYFSEPHRYLTKKYESHLLAGVFRHCWLEIAVDAGVLNNHALSPIIL